MRTDVKVGLICVFALVLVVVAYFALQSNGDKQKTAETTVVVPTASPAPSGVAIVSSPEATTATAPVTAPESPIAGGASLLGPRSAYAQADTGGGGSFTGPVIAPPGSATTAPAPYPGSPSLLAPTTGPAEPSLTYPTPSTPLLPPGGPNTSSYTPTTPAYTPTTPAHPTIEIPSTPSHRTPTIDVPFPAASDTFIPSSSGSTYVIQKGDMLGAIAKKNGVTLKALQAANPGVDPTRLKVGAKINIPAASSSTPTTPTTPTTHTPATTRPGHAATTRPATPGVHHHHAAGTVDPATSGDTSTGAAAAGGTYTVKKGDNLHKIAKALLGDDAAWKKIAAANSLKAPYDIEIGQVLKIPAK